MKFWAWKCIGGAAASFFYLAPALGLPVEPHRMAFGFWVTCLIAAAMSTCVPQTPKKSGCIVPARPFLVGPHDEEVLKTIEDAYLTLNETEEQKASRAQEQAELDAANREIDGWLGKGKDYEN